MTNLPEIYGFTGVVLFVVLSVFTSFFEEHFRKGISYLYEAAALAGLAQLVFISMNAQYETRVLTNLSYVTFSLANVGVTFMRLLRKGQVTNMLKMFYLSAILVPASLTVALSCAGLLSSSPIAFFTLPVESLPAIVAAAGFGLFLCALVTYSPNTFMKLAVLKVRLNHKNRKVKFE